VVGHDEGAGGEDGRDPPRSQRHYRRMMNPATKRRHRIQRREPCCT
jgi:hypothetical protein